MRSMRSATTSRASLAASDGHIRGSASYRRLTLAMLFAGFSTFSLLYAVQPLLPLFASEYRLSAEAASLAVSLATGPLAVGILFAGLLSDRMGRRPLMVAAMFAGAALTLAAAVAPGWSTLLLLRLLTGAALAGVPAVAMAYVAEEVHPGSVGAAMGLYIAGSALGGMGGATDREPRCGRRRLALGDRRCGPRRPRDGGGVPAARPALAQLRGRRRRAARADRRAAPRPRTAAALWRGVRADGHVRHHLQLRGLPTDGTALRPQPGGGGHGVPPLRPGFGEFGVVRRSGRQDRAAARVLGTGRAADRRYRAHRRAAAVGGDRGYRGGHDRLLRRAFDRERLGRTPRDRQPRAGGGALSLRLLPGIECARQRGRDCLDARGGGAGSRGSASY